MATRFAFSALFSAVGVAAAFDDAIVSDASSGRVNRAFAVLAANEYGLPMLRPDGNPVNKAAFLKFADGYRKANGKGHGIKGHTRLISWGVAFDTIALHLMAGADPSAEQVQALTESGQYRDALSWAAACPAPKKAEKKAAAPVKAAPAAPAAAPAPDMTPLPVITGSDEVGDEVNSEVNSEAGKEGAEEPASIGADVLFDAVMLGLQTGAFTNAELLALAKAVGEALHAAADVADEAATVAHALLSGHADAPGAALAH